MKKFLAILALGLTVLVAGTSTFYAGDEDWYGTNPDTHYSIADGVITSDDSFIFLGPDNIGKTPSNFFVTGEYATSGDYTVGVTVQGTEGLPVSKDVNMGIVPYYLDDQNFIIVYIQWATWDRPTDMRCAQFTGLINGKPIELFDGLYMEYYESKWNDNWLDGVQIPSTDEFTIEVDKRNAGDNVIFTFIVTHGGSIISSGEYYMAAEHFAEAGTVGVLANGDTVTFSNFTYNEIVEEPESEPESESESESEVESEDNSEDDSKNDSKDDTQKDDKDTTGEENPSSPVGTIIAIVAIVVVAVAVIVVVVLKKKKS